MKIKILSFFLLLIILSCTSTRIRSNAIQEKRYPLTDEELKIATKKYEMLCSPCHGLFGDLEVNGASNLSNSELSLEERVNVIYNGKGLMMPFKDIVEKKDMELISKYLDYLDKE